MGRKPLDKERVDDPYIKETWVKELATLYLQHGLGKFTMDKIAKKLNISKATLYKYFSSKDEIIDAVVQYKIQEIITFEDLLVDDNIDFSERFFEIIKTASIMLAEISGQFLHDTKVKHPELFVKMDTFSDRALYAAEKFYQQGIEAGVLNDIDPKILALTDKMFIQAVSNPKFLQEHNISVKEAFDNYFLMKSKGIFK
ncbi:TetR/AcrR family transcriptional regulator [Aureispira sp. CCB-E]|uniref:TetR/AcrR family transcriptional regulator n=1 Tax=Aureispira sp. CCB-E TaxID=3051121 RepID=UPI0028685717|nr:TetR/AcrR family transcriptional regulator [Aureispira sp. CCB-E]WMX15815.1 TetR/AcrR family transcriptional regulator [Aureispira sp. CCB-E]